MDFNKFFQSKLFKIILLGIGGLAALLLAFKAGEFVGYKKANFSCRWGENYHKNFGGPRNGILGDFSDQDDFMGAHGTSGQIIKIDPAAIVIKSQNSVEKIIAVKNGTVIKRFMDTIKLSDLKTDDYIVVIGDPNDAGQIEAKFIRLMPPRQ